MQKSKQNSILTLAKELIQVSSISTNNNSPATSVKELNTSLNLCRKHLKDLPSTKYSDEAVPSQIFYNTPTLPKKFKVILNAHLDVVGGKEKQFTPLIKGDRLYGRGSYDMKAAASVLLHIFKDVSKQVSYPLGLQLVTDEEVGGEHGTKTQVRNGIRTDFLLIGEPTNFDIIYKSKGRLAVKLFAKGVSGHAGYPWKGCNAIETMMKYLSDAKQIFPDTGKPTLDTTFTPTVVSTSNTAQNNIPDNCTVVCDIRTNPGDNKKVIAKLKSFLPKNIKLSVMLSDQGAVSDKSSFYIKHLAKTSSKVTGKNTAIRHTYGSSDARHFPHKTVTVEFGPRGADHHSINEWVSIKSLEQYYEIVREYLLSLDQK